MADHLARQGQILTVHDILEGMIKAHEIQGSLALLNSFNRVGLDHVVLVKVASTAVVSKLLYVFLTVFVEGSLIEPWYAAAFRVIKPLTQSHKPG